MISVISLSLNVHAESAPFEVKVKEGKNALLASFKLNGIIDDELRERIGSGLTNRLVITIWLESVEGSRRGAEKLHVRQAVFDVWDENHILEIMDDQAVKKKKIRDKNEVLADLVTFNDLNLAYPKPFKSGKYTIQADVNVNPPSKELIEKAKEYLSDPDGSRRLSAGRTAFGSFARTFIPSSISEKGRVYHFVSLPFVLSAESAETGK